MKYFIKFSSTLTVLIALAFPFGISAHSEKSQEYESDIATSFYGVYEPGEINDTEKSEADTPVYKDREGVIPATGDIEISSYFIAGALSLGACTLLSAIKSKESFSELL